MFKTGSKLLITAVLLAAAMTLCGKDAGAQHRSPVFEIPSGDTGGIEPIGSVDSGEPDIGQTGRSKPGDGGAPGGSEWFASSQVRYATSGWVRWITVMWTLRYLGLGT